jgi:hypothetical protein
VDATALDQLQSIKRARDVLAERLSRLSEARDSVSAVVYGRVKSDYEAQTRQLEGQAVPLKEKIRDEYQKLKRTLQDAERRSTEARFDQEEVELRHRVGELDDPEFGRRLEECERLVQSRAGELEALNKVKQGFLAAVDSESELEAAPQPPAPSPAAVEKPPAGSQPAAPRPSASPAEAPSASAQRPASASQPGITRRSPDPPPPSPAPPAANPAATNPVAAPAPGTPSASRPGVPGAAASPPPAPQRQAPPAATSGTSATRAFDQKNAMPKSRPATDPTGATVVVGSPPAEAPTGATVVLPLAPPKLVASDRKEGGEEVSLLPLTLLGRTPDNHVQINQPDVSRRHAEISFSERGYVLRDLGSENGTFVNGRRVEEHVLADGDHVQVGTRRFTFVVPK